MSIETTGKTIEEATAKAAKELGVEIGALNVTVLEESKGLFGKATIRIQATAKEAPAPKASKTAARAPRAAKATPEPEPEVVVEEAAAEAPVAAPAPAPAKRGLFGKSKDAAVAPAPAPAAAPKAEKEEAKSDSRPPRGGRREAAKPETAEQAAPKPEFEARAEYIATQEDADAIVELLAGLLGSAELNVTIDLAGLSGRYVNVTLDGSDVAYLVGKHGEVLNNLQYLTNIIIAQKLKRTARISLDGNQYRERREIALTALATGIAEQVRERGEEAVLDALPAFERRIVHKVLSEMDGVHTYSEGEEPNRRVVIAPAD